MKYIKFLATAVLLSGMSNTAYAGSATPCGSKTNIDYSDAPDSYGAACNQTQRWQSLGPGTDQGDNDDNKSESNGKYKGTEGYQEYSREDGVNVDGDEGDDGVLWRTSSDGGLTWSELGNDGVITQGDIVEFSFLVGRSQTGTHEFDQVKAWADWNIDGEFDEDPSEILIDEKWALNRDSSDVLDPDSNARWNGDLNTRNNTDLYRVYTVQMQIPLDAVTGDSWLRARIACENAVMNTHQGGGTLYATGYYDQGETEDYEITIAAKVVPEPSTLLVFAIGLIGMATARKKLNTK